MHRDEDGYRFPIEHVDRRSDEDRDEREEESESHESDEPGERVDVPRGVEHQFWNEADAETHIFGDLRPGRPADEFLPLAFALARDRWATRGGVPLNPLAVSAVFDAYLDYYNFAYVPIPLQKCGIRLLAPVARLLGYEAKLDESSITSQEPAD